MKQLRAGKGLHGGEGGGKSGLETSFDALFVKIAENQLFWRILLTSAFHSNCGQSRGKMP